VKDTDHRIASAKWLAGIQGRNLSLMSDPVASAGLLLRWDQFMLC